MSYCRFRNTLEDLKDCVEHLDDHDLSAEEAKAAQKLVEEAQSIASGYEGYQAESHIGKEED